MAMKSLLQRLHKVKIVTAWQSKTATGRTIINTEIYHYAKE